MPSGTVKWFDVKKGFGFITGPEGQDVFVHFSSILGDGFRTLKDGESVDYELLQGEKGFHARMVIRAPRLDGQAPAGPAIAGPAIAGLAIDHQNLDGGEMVGHLGIDSDMVGHPLPANDGRV